MDGFERLLLDAVPAEVAEPFGSRRLERESENAGEKRVDVAGLVAEDGAEPCAQLEPDPSLGIGQPHPKPIPQHLPDRPVRNVSGVRDGVTLEEPDSVAEGLPGLGLEPRLADPRLAADRDDGAS